MKARVCFSAFLFYMFAATCFGYSGGAGTAANPYQIATKADLDALTIDTANYNKYFLLTADINLKGTTYTTAIIAPDSLNTNTIFNGTAFTGSFDGNGYKISNLTISGGANDFLGLFGRVGENGVVKNLGIGGTIIGGSGSVYIGGISGENYGGVIQSCYSTASITGGSGSNPLGGLVGQNSGTIDACYATGAVNGTSSSNFGGLVGKNNLGITSACYATGTVNGTNSSYVGGLVGYNCGGTIYFCYSTGSVSGGNYLGGLVGYNQYYSGGTGDISNCYSSGSVTGTSIIGGLVGYHKGSDIDKCYSTGAVGGGSSLGGLVGQKYQGNTTNSFWDTETSGQTSSASGTGKTTVLMKTRLTFTSAGWDFMYETANGTNDYWRLCTEGEEYPYLSMEINEGDYACPTGVNTEDLIYLVDYWLATMCTASNDYCYGTDMDASGKVDMTDVAIFAGQWLEN